MRIKSLAYTEYEDQSYAWKLEPIEFNDINLIVGKNATGKTRVLRVLNALARMIDGTIQPSNILSGKYQVVFEQETSKKTDDTLISYSFSIFEQKIQEETLEINGVSKLKRGAGGRASLHFEKQGFTIDVQIPEINLASSSRRDSTQHPFFEPLHIWAQSIKYFEFAKTGNMISSSFEGKVPFEISQTIPLQTSLHLLVKLGKERYQRSFDLPIISDMAKIGYDITEFGLTPEVGISMPLSHTSAPQTLYVFEKGVEKRLLQKELSDGMVRALATLIYLHFFRLNKSRECLVIDDIGEGLDFDRSKRLTEVLIDRAETGYLKLIMTTNDRFIMNGVPLKYWCILHRDKGNVLVFNQFTSPEVFSNFEEYGFNNFDFFSKELYTQNRMN